MSFDEARNNFNIDASPSISTNYYMLVGDNAYGYSFSGTNLSANVIGDLDAYFIHLDVGSSYTIIASGISIFGVQVASANFALLDRNGKVLDLSKAYGGYSFFTFTATDSIYYIEEYSGSSGFYGMRVANNSIVEKNGIGEIITYGQIYSAALDYTSDVDIYTAYLQAGNTYYFSIQSNIPDIFLDVEYSQQAVASLVTSGSGLYYFTAGLTGYYDLHISSNNFINTGLYTLITQFDIKTLYTSNTTYILSAKGLNNLTYTGSADFTGFGNKNTNIIQGGIGNDKLDGLAGVDSLIGMAGDDTYTIDNTGDVVTENSNEGTDNVWVTIAKAGGVYTLTTNVENGYLLNKVAYSLNGNGLDNILVGNASANVLNGGAADDSIYGNLGKDTLIGGAGADGFYFDTKISSSNIDTITDFQSGEGGDYLYLDSLIFTGLSSTGYGADNFVVGAKALDSNDYLIFNPQTQTLSYDADGSGAGKAVAFVVLTGVASIYANDISVY
jgi:Ca2+-binding RTX toxin-like protein